MLVLRQIAERQSSILVAIERVLLYIHDVVLRLKVLSFELERYPFCRQFSSALCQHFFPQ